LGGGHEQAIDGNLSFEGFVENISVMSEAQFRKLFDELVAVRIMLEEVLSKSITVLPGAIHCLAERKSELSSVCEQLGNSELRVEGLREEKMKLEKQLNEVREMYEKLAGENL
jgi:hypothetical protein